MERGKKSPASTPRPEGTEATGGSSGAGAVSPPSPAAVPPCVGSQGSEHVTRARLFRRVLRCPSAQPGPSPAKGNPKRDPCQGRPQKGPLSATATGGPRAGPLPSIVAGGPVMGPLPPPQTCHGETLKRDARPRGDPTKDTRPPQRDPQGLRAADKPRAARTSHPPHRGPGRARSSTQGQPRRREALPGAPRTPDPRPHRRGPGGLRQPPLPSWARRCPPAEPGAGPQLPAPTPPFLLLESRRRRKRLQRPPGPRRCPADAAILAAGRKRKRRRAASAMAGAGSGRCHVGGWRRRWAAPS